MGSPDQRLDVSNTWTSMGQRALSVLVPTLHGDVGKTRGRPTSAPKTRLTLAGLLDLFPAGAERTTVGDLVHLLEDLGAFFEPGPSGTSVRIRTPLWPQPVTIAWFFGPGKQGWMRTADLSFGHPLADNAAAAPTLTTALDEYFHGIATLGVGSDASSKGVHAWRMSAADAAPRLGEISALMKDVILAVM